MKKEKEVKQVSKYRFVFIGLAAALLFVFGLIIGLNKQLAESIILYATAIILFLFALIRFVPLMKHLSDKRRLIMNAIEIFSNLLIGLVMVYIAMNAEVKPGLITLYRYLLAVVLFARGTIFLIEGLYCEGEKEAMKFVVHLGFIVCSTIVIAKEFDLTNLRWLIVAISLLLGSYCTVDSYISFNRTRKMYGKKEKGVEDETSVADEVTETPILDKQVEDTPVIEDQVDDRPYVN